MNHLRNTRNSLYWEYEGRVVLICLMFSAVVQLFINYDSPMHLGFKHIDGAWFLMCGKAMMNGMVPYVDFTDSKGPLLWLFNGLGYLIYPKGYEGLYVLFSLYFTMIFYLCYRTVRVILGCGSRYALLASFMMSLPYFVWCHDEMRCEDICQLPLIYCIYRLSLAIKSPESAGSLKAAFLMGVGIGCCVMVKWNQGVLLCLLPGCIMLISAIRRGPVVKPVAAGLGGIVAAIAPWIAVFGAIGNLNDFINEYFYHTAGTFSGSRSEIMATAAESYRRLLTSRRLLGLLFALSPLLLFRKEGWMKWLPAGCGLCYLLLLTYGGADYYMTGMAGFAIFLVCVVVRPMEKRWRRLPAGWLAAGAIAIIGLNAAWAVRYHQNFRFLNRNDEFDRLNELIASVPDARILHYNYFEQGLGLTSRTLPACRYWSMQSGGEAFSRPVQLATVKARKADFITVMSGEPQLIDPQVKELLDENRYVYVGSMRDYFGLRCNLYARKELNLRPI